MQYSKNRLDTNLLCSEAKKVCNGGNPVLHEFLYTNQSVRYHQVSKITLQKIKIDALYPVHALVKIANQKGIIHTD